MMSRKFIILPLMLCFVFIGCNNKDPYNGQYIDLSFEEKFTFGQPDSLSESTLHYARDIRVGPDGKIYVADASVAKIKIYSTDGKFVKSFGKRGRGPGEFTGIRGFAVTDSTVLVWDQNLQRINVFGLDGIFRTVHKIKGLPWPMRIYPMENSYLALHGGNRNPNQIKKTQLGHTYSEDFSKQKENFLTLNDVEENIEYVSRILLGGFGSILVQNNQQFLFVPYIYNGNLYEYSKTSKGWQQTRVFEGLNQQTPYSLSEDGDKRKPDVSISAVDLAEDKQFVAHNLTRGLFKYNGYIFHFVFCDINDRRVFGVEVYDKNVSPIGYAPIESIPITNKEGNHLNWFVEDVDKNGNFFFLQRNDKGTKVRLMKINDEELEHLAE